MELGAQSLWLLMGVFFIGYVMGRFARPTDEDKMLSQPVESPGVLLARLSAEARADVVAMLADKKMIPAIRRLREDTGAGLREAKLAVDELKRGL